MIHTEMSPFGVICFFYMSINTFPCHINLEEGRDTYYTSPYRPFFAIYFTNAGTTLKFFAILKMSVI